MKGYDSYNGLNLALVALYGAPNEVFELGPVCCLGVSEFLSMRVGLKKGFN